MTEHKSVLLNEAVEGLKVVKDGLYVDCNLGGGGHSREILKRGGLVLGLDVDERALEIAKENLSEYFKQDRIVIIKKNFREIKNVLDEIGWSKVDGIMYDLGLSTFQLKDVNRGFSFEEDIPMDMRMDDKLEVTANDLLVGLTENELAELFMKYGEEPQAQRFAHALKLKVARSDYKMTSKQVADAIKSASVYKTSKIHPATRVFQAFRIAVNSELEYFETSAKAATSLLKPKGRMVIISFHSLEDKIAKKLAKSPHLKRVNKKPITPSEDEIRLNPSARSAKLRIYEHI